MTIYPKTEAEVRQLGNIPEGEIKTWRIFSKLNNDWIVWYSREWLTFDKHVEMGEADFIVLNLNLGFITVEVKGGRIQYDAEKDKWNSRNKEGNHPIKDPFIQARKSMYKFINRFIEIAKYKNESGFYREKTDGKTQPSFNYGYMVAFPDCFFKDDFEKEDNIPAHWNSNLIFDQNDFTEEEHWWNYKRKDKSPLEKFLINILKAFLARESKTIINTDAIMFFKNMVNPSIKTYFHLTDWIETRQSSIDYANQQQNFIIELLEHKKRCLINGSAGTGKTFLAIKKVMHDYNLHQNVLYLCFNQNLKDFVQEYISLNFSSDLTQKKANILIKTIDGLLSITASKYQKEISQEIQNAITKRDYPLIFSKIDQLLKEIGPKNEYIFDSMIVDEAQDFENGAWKLIPKFLKSPESTFWVFYDLEQKIYNPDFDPKKIGFDLNEDQIFLGKNLRNLDKMSICINE
jgi:hypothetical protein